MDDWAEIRRLFSTGSQVQVQCDLWFPREALPLGRDQQGTPPVLVMTSSFSGFIQARMLPSKSTPDLPGGMWTLLQDAQAVPLAATLGQRNRNRRTLSPIAPETMFRNTVRLPRDYYVRVFTNDYSVDPSMIGRLVDVAADLDTVTVSHDGLVIASHERVWARQLTITDPDHVIKAAVLRKQFQSLSSRWPTPTDSVETRDLAAYDDLFGVDIDTEEQPVVLAAAS